MPPPVTINGAAQLPEKPVLVIPNRVDGAVLRVLVESLGGMEKIAWLVEDTLRPSPELMTQVSREGSQGILFSAARGNHETLAEQVNAKLESGRHVVLLPGHQEQPGAYITDVPMCILQYLLKEYDKLVLPVYAGMYGKPGEAALLTSEQPYEQAVVSFLSAFIPSGDSAERLHAAWALEACRCAANVTHVQEETLGSALLCSLTAHPRAVIIDGVNEQSMSYRRLLTLAAPLARRLRKNTLTRRMGIILPPGRLSIIANVACMLAGISPVNINYNSSKAIFRSIAEQAELTHFITGSNFMQKQPDFPWPPSRDILFVEEMLTSSGLSFQLVKEYLVGRLGWRRLASWMDVPVTTVQDEALMAYSLPEEGAGVRGVLLSHHAVMMGYRLAASRLRSQAGKRVLSSLPFYYRTGFMLGLVYPLLNGQDIITYPESDAAKRICGLAHKYSPTIMTLEPRQIPGILEVAQPGDFVEGGHVLVAGRVPMAVAQQAYRDHKIVLCECYMPPECAMPVACSMPPPVHGVSSPHVVPAGAPGTAGLVMPGLAVRVTNHLRPDVPLGTGELGLLWVKGEPLFSGFVQDGMPAPDTSTNRWVCTGDIGCIRADGLLVVGGSRERFSYIEGELISHARVEEILADILSIPRISAEPRIAVVGTPTSDGRGEQVVLLSTLHKVVGPHDVITLRYAIVNERIASQYAPQRIVALRAIPTLPGGGVDYAFCRRLALSAPGYRRNT